MNNTSIASNSPSCSFGAPNTVTKIAFTTAYALVFIVATLGNCIIIQIARTRRCRGNVTFNFFIISMATADILDALIAVPTTVLYLYIPYRWFGGLVGHITCKLLHFLNVLSLAASVLNLTAISVERYMCIVHIWRKPLSARKVKIVIAVLWLFAAATTTTFLYKFEVLEESDGVWVCHGSWSSDPQEDATIFRYETIARFLFLYAIPLIMMSVLHCLSIHRLKKLPKFDQNISQVRIQQQNKMVVRMLVTVVVIFAVCWFPMWVLALMIIFKYGKLLCLPISVIWSMFWPAHANGAINPWIYVIFSEDFRKGIKELLTKCGKRKQAIVIQPKRVNQRSNSIALIKDAYLPTRNRMLNSKDFRRESQQMDQVFDTRL